MEAADRTKMLSAVAFACATAIVVASALLYLYNIFKWADYPEFGFGFRTATGIHVVGEVTEPGRSAGIEVGDRILEVNGKSYATMQEFRSALKRKPGEINTYHLLREGQWLEVTIENTPAGFTKALGFSGLPYIVGLCYAVIGILVFLMKPHERTTWVFFLFASIFGLFLMFLLKFSVMSPFWLENLVTFTYTFTPAVFIHLALGFPEERALLKRHPYAQLLPYVVSMVLFVCIRSSTPTILDTPLTLLIVTVVYIAVGVLVFIGSCVQLLLRTRQEIVKVRAKMILLGFAVAASLPLADTLINALFNVYLVPSPSYYLPFFVVFPLAVGYSIIKHNLFDFDTIIRRTYGYVLTTLAIAGTYGVFVLLSNLAFGSLEIAKSPALPLIFVLAVVFLFNPVRNRAQRFIDRVFYRLEYDYRETVQRLSETMRSLLKLDDILKAMMDIALGVMFIDSGRVMLLNREGQAYECLAEAGKREARHAPAGIRAASAPAEAVAAGTMAPAGESGEGTGRTRAPEVKLPADDPFIRKLAERKKEVTLYDIQEAPFFAGERESCRKAFDRLEATLVVPLIYEERLTGLISLGEKKSGKFYRREDVNLLTTLANQGAVAIENAKLLEEVIEKERMEEELAIARDLQTSMLPAACPQIRGFDIAATSVPAREVGGDFFDFIEIGEGRLGLVIGDVTGKSVSGALVVSASRSVFRMLSEERLTVGEIMGRANRRLKKDVTRGMFVALLYAVLDARNRTLTLCSAGQTQPVHVCGRTGEARLVETLGDTFPLGILDDADYRETRLELGPGDRVVFYTDGIVEAADHREEMFGFELLLEVVRGGKRMSADALLKEVLRRVTEFAGGAAQHDDLTVIVLGVTE